MYTPLNTKLTQSTPYQEGVKAGGEAPGFIGLHRNPYPEKTVEHDQWTLGWCKGFADQPD